MRAKMTQVSTPPCTSTPSTLFAYIQLLFDFFIFFVFLVRLGFELRASHLQSSTT
jgi:hypothetical protein